MTDDNPEVDSAAEDILAILTPLSPEVRMAVLSQVGEYVCRHCGGDQPDSARRCQCWNDE